jgi:hypothetical protein
MQEGPCVEIYIREEQSMQEEAPVGRSLQGPCVEIYICEEQSMQE